MASTAVHRVIRSARQAVLGQDAASLTDGALLEAFVQGRDEAAFAALVRRHGAMVLGVCRRVLRNEADAEDAFQATFLILARKAASIRSTGAVGNWLYGVAHTTAVKALAMIRKRRAREREAAARPRTEACEEVWRAVQALLDAELAALPDKYRTPIVLCALEGKTIQDAARQLGWPQGTVASRLARGKAQLARRLARHGLVVSAGALAAALAHGAAAAQVPSTLVVSTIKAGSLLAAGQAATGLVSTHVSALTQGVLQTMFLSKLKLCIAGVVVLTLLGTGAVSLCRATAGGETFSSGPAAQDTPPAKQIKPPADPLRLQQEIERLRAELARTQAQLKVAQQELKLIKAKAEEDRAIAELEELRLQAPAAKAKEVPPQAPDQAKPKQPEQRPGVAVSSPDGRILVTSQGATLIAFDIPTGKVLFKSLGHNAPVQALAFSPDGKRLVSGGPDKLVLAWDSQTGKLIQRLETPGPVITIRFSGDGRTIIIREGDQTVREVDAATGKELRVLRGKRQAK